MIRVVHHPDYVVPGLASGGHRRGKNGAIRDLLAAEGDAIKWHVPEAAPREWIETVHDPDYVAEVLAARVPAEKERRIGFAVTPAVARRSAIVAGGTYLAARLALRHGFAANSAGGSHHALGDSGAGYCVLNDLAIAAMQLAAEGRRVLIVDVDVHQGDGTAALTAGHRAIATYSIHAEKNFPTRKARSTLDVPLPDGTGDDDYCAALEDTLAPLVAGHDPDVILYQGGVDPFAGDRLGRLALSDDGLARRDLIVARLAIACGVPIASTVGGGYGDDVDAIARRHVAVMLRLGHALEKAWVAAGDNDSRLAHERPGA